MKLFSILLHNRAIRLTIRWILYVTLAGVFIVAGAQKISSPQNFADSIASFALLPGNLINLVALALPPFEILLGLAILTAVQRRAALLGIALLTTVFIVALASAIARGLSVDCGCFGSGEPSPQSAWIAIGRDIPLLAAALWLYFLEYRKTSASADSAPQV